MKSTYSFSQFIPITGKHLQLVALAEEHIPMLVEVLFHPDTFFVAHRGYKTKEKVEQTIRHRLMEQLQGKSLTVVAIDLVSHELAAMSTFLSPNESWLKIEIGFTWVCEKFKRTYVNTEMKLLMLDYAFANMHVRRVEFSVDPENEGSLKAMKRLGAVYEGTLRKWRFNSETDKGNRSIFSVIDDEWSSMRNKLTNRLVSGQSS